MNLINSASLLPVGGDDVKNYMGTFLTDIENSIKEQFPIMQIEFSKDEREIIQKIISYNSDLTDDFVTRYLQYSKAVVEVTLKEIDLKMYLDSLKKRME